MTNDPATSSEDVEAAASACGDALVSVIIPAYNAAGTIERTLDTVAAQTYAPMEIIVIDDGSSDRTVEIVRCWTRMPVRLIELPANSGPAGARNAGIGGARGTYVAFLDADDEWAPTKIARQLELFEADDACSLVTCDTAIVSAGGQTIGHQFDLAQVARGRDAWKAILQCNFVATSSVLTRKVFLDEIGGFDPDLLISQDQDVWIKLALLGSVGVIDDALVRYNMHAGSHITRNGNREAEFLLPMIERHVTRQRSRLSKAEAKGILRLRLTQIGRNAYVGGAPITGLRLLLRAVLMGSRPLEQLFFVLHASPPGRFLKRVMRARNAKSAGDPRGSDTTR